jgi:hypothetical protein
MQESSVGWDPAYIDHYQPWQGKIFILYLLLVLMFSFVRLVSIGRQLCFGSLKRRVISDDGVVADSAGRRQADAKFLYTAEISSTKVAGMKNLAMLTLIVSGLLPLYELLDNLRILQVEKAWGLCGGGR